MGYAFFRIIMLSIWFVPIITTAQAVSPEPQSKKLEWNNFATHFLLKNRDLSQGYLPKVGGGLEAVGDATALDITGLRAGIHFSLPWTTILMSCDIPEYLMCEDELRTAFNVIIGDLNRFPIYFQIGLLNAIVGRHASELLPTLDLVTRQAFYKKVDFNSFSLGGVIGGYYSLNDHSEVKLAGFLHDNGGGINGQYDITHTVIHFLAGGGIGSIDNNSRSIYFGNFYTEVSGQEGLFNNLVKFKAETIGWRRADRANYLYAWHTEFSYHLPLYYFGSPSAVVVGYSQLSDQAIRYVSLGMKAKFFKYFDFIAGATCGKVTQGSSSGVAPLLQLQFSL